MAAVAPAAGCSVQYLVLIPSSRVIQEGRTTLTTIFRDPVPPDVRRMDVEHLVAGAGGTVREGRGSRVRFELNGVRANFHPPGPGKEAKRYQVQHLRDFFTAAGVIP